MAAAAQPPANNLKVGDIFFVENQKLKLGNVPGSHPALLVCQQNSLEWQVFQGSTKIPTAFLRAGFIEIYPEDVLLFRNKSDGKHGYYKVECLKLLKSYFYERQRHGQINDRMKQDEIESEARKLSCCTHS